MRRIKNIHMIGIGGVGMGGIAEVLHNLGYVITGSDLQKNTMTERLSSLGINITYAHISQNVIDADAVVVSSAIAPDNIELKTAKSKRIPIVPRAEMLAELMRFKHGIAVAGTHGKTTTTSLIANVLTNANLSPTFVIGGKLNNFGFNAKLGDGKYFIAEADESDASFLHLNPMISVITNIDNDHLETYDDNLVKLKEIFIEFIHRLPFYGLAILCIDDKNVRDIISNISRPFITYGFSEDADVKISNFKQTGLTTKFTIEYLNEEPLDLNLNLGGEHNVLNDVAAFIVAKETEVDNNCIKSGFKNFQGIARRQQLLGKFNIKDKQVKLFDDYGHHPKEVEAIINTMRNAYPGSRIVMVYQPHRYTRTKALFDDFSNILSDVDVLLLLDVYSANEEPIPGADSRALCSSIRQRNKIEPIYIDDNIKILPNLENLVKDGDVVIMQGAGDVSKIAQCLISEINLKKKR